MIIIHHRINNLIDLEEIPANHGIEVDVRYHQNHLILHHDPFDHDTQVNTKLIDLLDKWKNTGPLVLNLKSEGIEESCIKAMEEYKVKSWFFLDMSMPYLVKYSDKAAQNEPINFSPDNLAVRFSDREPIEYALSFKGKARWVWVDYFSEFPLNQKTILLLRNAKFKICLCSPELQKKSIFKPNKLAEICSGFDIDAVCTKDPEIWSKVKS